MSETEASTTVTSQETETVTSGGESTIETSSTETTSVSTTQSGTEQSTVSTEYLSTEEG